MTPTSYYIASIARSFGFQRRNKRLSDASTEMGLLREAEFQLGQHLWEKIEPIEDLSVEYWNLRKLTVEQNKVEIAIENLKSEFRSLKIRRQEMVKEIEEGDRLIDVIDSKLAEFKQEKRDRASVVFQQMGELNRDLSLARSQIGTIELQIHQLKSEVGRYLSRYTKRNPLCAKIAMEQRTMVEVMRLLRISIAMNNKLAGFK